jgi:hypothetical protein
MKYLALASIALCACGVNSDVSATATTNDATLKLTGALLHVNPGGVDGSAGKQFTFNFALAKSSFVPTDSSTYLNFSADFSVVGDVQAKTYDSTGTDGCLGIVYHYKLANGTGTDFLSQGSANTMCDPGDAQGSWSAKVTDAKAPHGTITATLAEVSTDDMDTQKGTSGMVTIDF